MGFCRCWIWLWTMWGLRWAGFATLWFTRTLLPQSSFTLRKHWDDWQRISKLWFLWKLKLIVTEIFWNFFTTMLHEIEEEMYYVGWNVPSWMCLHLCYRFQLDTINISDQDNFNKISEKLVILIWMYRRLMGWRLDVIQATSLIYLQ